MLHGSIEMLYCAVLARLIQSSSYNWVAFVNMKYKQASRPLKFSFHFLFKFVVNLTVQSVFLNLPEVTDRPVSDLEKNSLVSLSDLVFTFPASISAVVTRFTMILYAGDTQ